MSAIFGCWPKVARAVRAELCSRSVTTWQLQWSATGGPVVHCPPTPSQTLLTWPDTGNTSSDTRHQTPHWHLASETWELAAFRGSRLREVEGGNRERLLLYAMELLGLTTQPPNDLLQCPSSARRSVSNLWSLPVTVVRIMLPRKLFTTLNWPWRILTLNQFVK